MDETIEKMRIARNTNRILKRLFSSAKNTEFNANVDLENFNSSSLRDFWLYISGFISIINNKDLEYELSIPEINNILSGKFILKHFTQEQAETIANKANVKFNPKKEAKVELYKIQDGTYYLNAFKSKSGNIHYYLNLETAPLEFHTDTENKYVSRQEVFAQIKNVFSHGTPYITDQKLIFLFGDDEIHITKMWLRGYSELFSKKEKYIDSRTLEKKLRTELNNHHNELSGKGDLHNAIDLITHILSITDNEQKETFISSIKTRLNADSDFFNKSFNDKITTLSSIIANNPYYNTFAGGTLSSAIIYNLQNLVGMELVKREEEEPLSDDDEAVKEFNALMKEMDALRKSIETVTKLQTTTGKRLFNAKKYEEKQSFLNKRADKLLKVIEYKTKLESSHMDIFEFEDLKNLGPEIAVNVVLMMAYNSMIASSFHEDVVRYTDFSNLTDEQSRYFKSFNFGNIERYRNEEKILAPKTPSHKAFMLLCLRNALRHGNVRYYLPEDNSFNLNNIILEFDAQRQGSLITGKLLDFYNLFSSTEFYKDRPDSIKTHYSDRYKTDEDPAQ